MPTVLITGSSRGLGLEFVRQYAAASWDVIACARDPAKATQLRSLEAESGGRVEVQRLDVADFAAIDSLAQQLTARSIDVPINDAGSMGGRGSGFGASDFGDWEQVFRVNSFAPMKMAEAFAPHIARSTEKKLLSISSVMASMAQNTMGGFYAYRASKAALNAITVSLALDLGRRHGIIVAVLHPGWVRTDMGGTRAELEPGASVSGMRAVIAGLTKDQAGRFWSHTGAELPW